MSVPFLQQFYMAGYLSKEADTPMSDLAHLLKSDPGDTELPDKFTAPSPIYQMRQQQREEEKRLSNRGVVERVGDAAADAASKVTDTGEDAATAVGDWLDDRIEGGGRYLMPVAGKGAAVGAGVGTAAGAGIGAALDKKKRIRGALMGALLGGGSGAILGAGANVGLDELRMRDLSNQMANVIRRGVSAAPLGIELSARPKFTPEENAQLPTAVRPLLRAARNEGISMDEIQNNL